MNKIRLFVLLMMCLGISYAQVYKWTDSQDIVHFSDNPHQGAEAVKMPDAQSYSPPTSSADGVGGDGKSNANPGQQKTNSAHEYNKLTITQPLNESTIRNNEGYVVVVADADPHLVDGDLFQVLFDGSPLGEPQSDPIFQLNGIYRGTHTVSVQIIDAEAKAVITSAPVTFHMHRPRVGMVK